MTHDSGGAAINILAIYFRNPPYALSIRLPLSFNSDAIKTFKKLINDLFQNH